MNILSNLEFKFEPIKIGIMNNVDQVMVEFSCRMWESWSNFYGPFIYISIQFRAKSFFIFIRPIGQIRLSKLENDYKL